MIWTGGFAHGASHNSVTARFPTIRTGGYAHGVKASTGLDSTTCTKGELVAST